MIRIIALILVLLTAGTAHADNKSMFKAAGINNKMQTDYVFPLQNTIVPSKQFKAVTLSFARSSLGTFYDFEGVLRTAKSDEPRFVGARRVQNLYTATATLTTKTTTVVAGTYDVSFTGTGTITFTGAYSGSLVGQGAGTRVAATITTTAGTLTSTVSGTVTLAQLEQVDGQSNQNPSEYVSAGTLSAPYQGANVDGVQYFSTLNSCTVSSAVVTGCGTGDAITNSNASYADAKGPFGYLSEPTETNYLRYSRNMTQTGYWTAVNVTTALTQTGIDGLANSASLLTASSAAGTVLQTVTQTSQSATYTAYVKRVTGTGTITIQQGATTLDITSSINSSTWTRVALNASVLNPVVGFIIATSGDAIAVDYNQLEIFAGYTMPILTTTATASRSGDSLGPTGVSKGRQGSFTLEYTPEETITAGTTSSYGENGIIGFGTSFRNFELYNGYLAMYADASLARVSSPAWSPVTANTVYYLGSSWSYPKNTMKNFLNGTAGTGGTTYSETGTTLYIGSNTGSTPSLGSIRNLTVYTKNLPDSVMQTLTTP